MFFKNQTLEEKRKYEMLLKIIGGLSRLSSDSNIPYLYYRMAENIFCRSFEAINLARSDISIDAKKGNIGLGLKTFINKSCGSIEKIAEFNKNKIQIDSANDLKNKIKTISRLRNERLNVTSRISEIDISNMFYHCILREKDKFIIHEDKIHPISLENIRDIKESNNNTVSFSDGYEKYVFNFSKSTLYKKFNSSPVHEIPIKIFDDPYDLLEKYFSNLFQELKISSTSFTNTEIERVCLPLFSYKKNKGNFVPERSGLNQWNANGRQRSLDEVYIPIPAKIQNKFPRFFPKRDTAFTLRLPSGSSLLVKVCQENGKALMSNPNSELGDWILRKVLNLKEGELLTYKKLENIGIDTVEISKFSDETFEINFKKLGTYTEFCQKYVNP